MHIEKIIIEGIPPIGIPISLDCDERVNLLIGPNASGKSTVLRAMEYVFSPEEDHQMTYLFDQFEDSRCEMISSGDWPCSDLGPIWNSVPIFYMPATRVTLSIQPGPSELVKMLELVQEQVNILLQIANANEGGEPDVEERIRMFDRFYEMSEAINRNPLESLFGTSKGVFYGAHLETAIAANRAQGASELRKQYYQQDYERALQLGYACARKICSEIIHDYSPHPFLEVPEDAWNQDDLIVHANMGIGTSDVIGRAPLYIGSLSSGTQGTLLWIYALALKMAQHYDWEEGWEKEPVILLIDEIENHLHPTWQRRVIPALLDHFPKLQIFATTHSPFVVAGLKAGQVHLLGREGGRVTATTNSEDIVGWTMDEILRTMMGVTDPTDDETARTAEELRELRKEGPRSDERSEEQRQRRMRELRQRVNRDLLAGGPEKAQREEFEQQFAEALLRYQEIQSLDQDSG